MAKKTAPLLPSTDELLRQFGGRLRAARLRRRLTAKQVAERAGMAPMTLRSLERGGSGVTIGAYLAVMQVLGVEQDLALLGKADPLGRELQDARLPARWAPVDAPLAQPREAFGRLDRPATRPQKAGAVRVVRKVRKVREPSRAQGWIENSGFASAQALAGLIDSPAAPASRASKKRR